MMERADKGLAFMLQYENVAWYEDGAVKILDRRVYPAAVRYEICRDHREVAKAIADMVTQSAGPYSAAAMVSQAYKAIGSAYRYSGYVWTGNPATSAFTCSGLVDFALGRPTNSSWPTSLYAEVQGAGGIKNSISKLNYGDLVFTGSGGIGHVGIYVGDGCFLDSSWDGVSVRAINPSTFIGGGSIF